MASVLPKNQKVELLSIVFHLQSELGFDPILLRNTLHFELLGQVSGQVIGRNLKSSENTLKAALQLDFCHVKVRKAHHCADARNNPVFASF